MKNIATTVLVLITISGFCQLKTTPDLTLTLNVRKTYESNIFIVPFSGTEPIATATGVRTSCILTIPKSYLPGQFTMHIEYKSSFADKATRTKLEFFMNKQNMEWNINPAFIKGDSLIFITDEENSAYKNFMFTNHEKRQQISLLEQIIISYPEREGTFFTEAKKEYSNQIKSYNSWIDEQKKQYNNLYISHLFDFQKVHSINPDITEDEMLQNMINSYFEFIDFNDTLIINTNDFSSSLNKFMDFFSIQAQNGKPADSLFVAAGDFACTKASSGHSTVYGWVVDYYYRGYEQAAMNKGIEMLEKHINNPNCYTQKRAKIEKRLEGMKQLVPGVKAPDYEAYNYKGELFKFSDFTTQKKYCTLIFYDSQCPHCIETLDELKSWYTEPANRAKTDIITVSMDIDEKVWKDFSVKSEFDWVDVLPQGGLNGKTGNDYYILSTPVIFILDNTKTIQDLPQEFLHFKTFFNSK